MKRAAAIAIAIAALAAAPPSALADAIDGEWCSHAGENLLIKGPRIRLPSGAEIDGLYRRHEFSFDAPPGDPHAGETAYLELLSEEDMLFRWIRNGLASEPELWRRCNVTS
jgi:hypothetical protein